MTENILDDEFEISGVEQIPDRIICEIKLSERKYPEKVIKLIHQEINDRDLVISNFKSIFRADEETKINLLNWIKNNPKTSILILFTAILAGTTGSIVVLISVYAAIHINHKSKKRIWRLTNLLISLLIIGVMVLSFLI